MTIAAYPGKRNDRNLARRLACVSQVSAIARPEHKSLRQQSLCIHHHKVHGCGVICTTCKRESFQSESHCARCGAALSARGAGEFSSGTSTMVGPGFFVRPGATSRYNSVPYAVRSRRRRMRASLALLVLGVIAIAWVLWRAPIPLPDSRPIIAMDKMIKSLRNRSNQDLRASAITLPVSRSQAVTSSHPASLRTATIMPTAGESRPTAKLPNEIGSLGEAHEQQDQAVESNNVSVNDHAAAAASLEEAVVKGDRDAPVRLANMYFTGEGVPRSCEQALALLRTAASKPNVRARNRLAAVYAIGICVPRDRVQAYRWLALSLAADPDNVWAQQNRALTWREMTPEERNIADADQ